MAARGERGLGHPPEKRRIRRGVVASYLQVSERKHLNPTAGPSPGVHPTRRQGGARRELSERVLFRLGSREVDGWALNASRSGLRAILEETVPLGAELEVEVGEAPARPGRIVWVQEEHDGAIVGVSFLDEAARSGSIPDIQVVGRGLTPAPGSVRAAPPASAAPAPPRSGEDARADAPAAARSGAPAEGAPEEGSAGSASRSDGGPGPEGDASKRT